MSNLINIKGLKKTINHTKIFSNLNCQIEKGKITALWGPNGCGKSTLLNILSGLETSDSGECTIINFHSIKFSYIFQNYRDSLFTWRDCYSNLAFPLEVQGLPNSLIRKKINQLKLEDFGISLHQYPRELSGGQQQILAFFRAIITEPKLLFIDEPFSSLDYENNLLLREKIQEYYLKEKPTILLVSHNIEEAVHLADRIVIFSKKPTQVIESIVNKVRYPRTINFLKTEEFNNAKNRIISRLQKEVNI